MKNIYILDEYKSSTQNGIGTFLKELIKCFRQIDTTICLIEFNTPNKGFEIKKSDEIVRIQFPFFFRNDFFSNYKVVDKFFRLYINDSPNNLFILNHSPCEGLLKIMKLSFPLSRITFVIHEFGWTNHFLGDGEKVHQHISNKDRKIKKNSIIFRLIRFFQIEQRMYSTCHRIICLSENALNTLLNVYNIPEDKISMIPNGLEDDITGPISDKRKKQIKKSKGIGEEEQIILFVGRATKAKGIFALLKAFKKVIKKGPPCRLVIIGSIHYPSLVLKEGKNLTSRVNYTGAISKKELYEWYQIANIGVIPSYTEQCTYTGIEMMKFGLPIVSSDGFGLKSMFQDKNNSLVAPIGNREKETEFINNLTESLLRLLHSKDLQKSFQIKARQTYEKLYISDVMLEGYKKFLVDIFSN